MGKRVSVWLVVMIFLFLHSTNLVLAHPGNTDANGGHTCRTNCDDWGLGYGEYHYHNGNSNGTDDFTKGYNKGYEVAYSYTSQCEEDYKWWWEGSQTYGDGFEKGIKEGHDAGLEVCYETSKQEGYDQGYADNQDGVDFDSGNSEDYDPASYEEGYQEGWDEAEAEAPSEEEEKAVSIEPASTSETEDWNMYSDKLIYEMGYDEGYEAAQEGYTYDDYEEKIDSSQLGSYKKGYHKGYMEGGAGNPLDYTIYLAFQKYWWATTAVGVTAVPSFIFYRKKKKKQKVETPPQ